MRGTQARARHDRHRLQAHRPRMNPASTTAPATMSATSTPSTTRCALAPGISSCISRRRPAWSLPYRRSQPHPRSETERLGSATHPLCGADRPCRAGGTFTSAAHRCGRCRGKEVWAIPLRGHGLSVAISAALRFPLRSLSPPVADRSYARCACQEGSQVCASIAGAVPGGSRRRGLCRWNKQILLRRDGSLCHTCSLRQPRLRRGPPLRWRSVAAGTRNETALKRLGPARRATVAQSLRSLRPHHSRTAPRHSFRPRWLRCARVSQRTITSGQTLRTVQLKIGRSS